MCFAAFVVVVGCSPLPFMHLSFSLVSSLFCRSRLLLLLHSPGT